LFESVSENNVAPSS